MTPRIILLMYHLTKYKYHNENADNACNCISKSIMVDHLKKLNETIITNRLCSVLMVDFEKIKKKYPRAQDTDG